MLITLSMECPFCGNPHFVTVKEDEYNQYMEGAHAQVVFSSLSATEREQVISHICPDCQSSLFDSIVD